MTIAELLVGAGISLFVVGTVFAAVRVQGRSAAYQGGLADAQLTSRGAGELLLQDLRMAGFGMLGVSPADAATYPPLDYDIDANPKVLTLRGAFANVTTTLAIAAGVGDGTLTVSTPPAGTSFEAGNLVLVDSGLSSEVFPIAGVNGNVITLDGNLANDYPVGPFVTQIEVVTYTYGPVNGTNVLRRNNQVVAENVPNFTIRFVDESGLVTQVPGDYVRSVLIDFQAAQPSALPGSPTARSHVSTEANMRNLAFRFAL